MKTECGGKDCVLRSAVLVDRPLEQDDKVRHLSEDIDNFSFLNLLWICETISTILCLHSTCETPHNYHYYHQQNGKSTNRDTFTETQ